MDLRALLQPNGDRWKIVPYVLLYSFVGASAFLAIAIQYNDYVWATFVCVYALSCAVLVLAAGYLVWFVFGTRIPTPAALALTIVLGCVGAQLIEISLHYFMSMSHPSKGLLYQLGQVRGPLLWWGVAAAAWYMVRRADLHAAMVTRTQLAGEELRARMAEARLQALQAQVEPHFLFNTLANVKWLYRRDPERGRRMLDRLLDYLEAALPRVRQSATTLAQELQLTHAYLDIQQLRIGGRLTFDIEVPEDIARLHFPPLMLLTLVENAIKHGIAPRLEGGAIAIRAHAEGDRLRIEVRDTGVGLRDVAGKGMGLANVRARLAALFGAGARLVIEPNAPHGVIAAIEIPR